MNLNKIPQELKVKPETILKLISTKIEEWYGVKLEPNCKKVLPGQFVPSFEKFEAYRTLLDTKTSQVKSANSMTNVNY